MRWLKTWRLLLWFVAVVVALAGISDRLVSSCQGSLASASEVERLAELVGLQPGMNVAEIGAGDGRMAVGMARRLKQTGAFYATELEADQLNAIEKAAKAAGVNNVRAVLASENSAELPEACCDVVYMRRVYHHFGNREAMNRSLHASLRDGGRLVVIDFKSPAWRFYRPHGIDQKEVIAHLKATGFRLEREDAAWSWLDYCLVFRKAPVATATLAERLAP